LQAAFRLADANGLPALTMRALGNHLGVDPTAVYRHFPIQERLVDAVLDAILGEASLPPEAPD
jgi:AcrR family transcriptional regulator